MSVISIEDRTAISDVISLYGIVIDERQWPLVTALFTDDAVYDITDFNADVLNGLDNVTKYLFSMVVTPTPGRQEKGDRPSPQGGGVLTDI